MVLNWMKLFASVADMVLGQDTSNCLLASIGFHDCPLGSMKLSEHESR